MDGSVDFFCNWASYVDGFGDLDGEYWLGLKNIHCLTLRAESTQLRVSLSDFAGVKKFATYSLFSVGNPGTKYHLDIVHYTGTAGDAMKDTMVIAIRVLLLCITSYATCCACNMHVTGVCMHVTCMQFKGLNKMHVASM